LARFVFCRFAVDPLPLFKGGIFHHAFGVEKR